MTDTLTKDDRAELDERIAELRGMDDAELGEAGEKAVLLLELYGPQNHCCNISKSTSQMVTEYEAAVDSEFASRLRTLDEGQATQ